MGVFTSGESSYTRKRKTNLMSNKMLRQFLYSPNAMLTEADGGFTVGATGAVSATTGNLISSITRLGVGTYRITLLQPFNHFYDFSASFVAPVTGSALAVDSVSAALSVGVAYQITTLGDATAAQWLALGVPSGITPALGVTFVALATGNGAAGSARVKALANSTIVSVELVGNPDLQISNPTAPSLIIQCLGATSSSVTTLIPADPVSGSLMKFHMFLRNSSVAY